MSRPDVTVAALVERDLAPAPGVLPPANLPVVRHAVAGFTVRTDMLGVTSIVRALNLNARYYNALVDHFHSAAVKLDQLTALWTQVVLRLFPQPCASTGALSSSVTASRSHYGDP